MNCELKKDVGGGGVGVVQTQLVFVENSGIWGPTLWNILEAAKGGGGVN